MLAHKIRRWLRLVIQLVTRSELIRRALLKYCAKRYMHLAPAHPFDKKYGITTSGFLPGSVLRLGYPLGKSTADSAYLGDQPSIIRRALEALSHHEDATFLDVGCGKGRALVVASEFPLRSIIGVEICPELANVAKKNAQVIARNFPRRTPISVVDGNALDYTLPEGNLIIFLYNPFGERMISRLLENIENAVLKNDNSIWVIYTNPVCGYVFDRSSALSRILSETIPYDRSELGFGPDSSEVVSIWQGTKNAPSEVPESAD